MGIEITPENIVPLASIFSTMIIAIFTILFTTVLGPRLQESSRKKSEREIRVWSKNEERFFNMLTFLEGFYVGKLNTGEALKYKKEFVRAYRHVWLYSPDEVIRKINDFFISSGYDKQIVTPQGKAARDMIHAMRQTIYGDTKLKPEEFLIASAK